MPRKPALTARKVVRQLLRAGFVMDHARGSHRVYYHPGTGKRAVVPFHNRDLPRGTLLAILKQAGLDPDPE